MNLHSPVLASLLAALSLFGAQAGAGTPAGQLTQLSGFVMAVKADGVLKVLSPQSVVEVGDTLTSEQDTYVRIGLADGRQAVLGPHTRLKIASVARLDLAEGQLQVLAGPAPGAGRLVIEAGDTTVDAGTGSFNLFYRPDPAVALARRAYAQASLALAPSPVQSDAEVALPVWEKVAQVQIPSAPRPPSASSALLPGLYVQVIDGLINMSNKGGSQSYSPGQFGYTPNFAQPPAMLPKNPGLQFTLPATFSIPTTGGSASNSGAKNNAVDCEVR
ncbi:hypothetical protein C7T35_16310 [Variovorax sp. WS11]|uniref:FecR domain-containing protein n=1 Tax=Variovorax sp. WS11 TaxID=1105204 RepID=UPI000D2C496B|nr:FecR domain-containing protein [Variovorax sp. WS11]NDZ13122.1 FecR domain-containing protein [Variovorax sp. WS11]PSL83450.1 hypothetical protein C7T35_16310 [Variovorax sp. WS11]